MEQRRSILKLNAHRSILVALRTARLIDLKAEKPSKFIWSSPARMWFDLAFAAKWTGLRWSWHQTTSPANENSLICVTPSNSYRLIPLLLGKLLFRKSPKVRSAWQGLRRLSKKEIKWRLRLHLTSKSNENTSIRSFAMGRKSSPNSSVTLSRLKSNSASASPFWATRCRNCPKRTLKEKAFKEFVSRLSEPHVIKNQMGMNWTMSVTWSTPLRMHRSKIHYLPSLMKIERSPTHRRVTGISKQFRKRRWNKRRIRTQFRRKAKKKRKWKRSRRGPKRRRRSAQKNFSPLKHSLSAVMLISSSTWIAAITNWRRCRSRD